MPDAHVRPEEGTVRVTLPSGSRTDAVLARDGDREYLGFGGSQAFAANDRIRVDPRTVRVARAAFRHRAGRSATVALLAP